MATLFSIWEPATDPSTLDAQDYEYMSRICDRRDIVNSPPKIEPSYSVNERAAVMVWRAQAQFYIISHMASHPPLGTALSGRSRQPAVRSLPQQSYPEHRVFQVTELLDLILQYAGPEVQVQALSVCMRWRSSALAVIGSQLNVDSFRTLQPCTPINMDSVLMVV
jgi:hypothetical protein